MWQACKGLAAAEADRGRAYACRSPAAAGYWSGPRIKGMQSPWPPQGAGLVKSEVREVRRPARRGRFWVRVGRRTAACAPHGKPGARVRAERAVLRGASSRASRCGDDVAKRRWRASSMGRQAGRGASRRWPAHRPLLRLVTQSGNRLCMASRRLRPPAALMPAKWPPPKGPPSAGRGKPSC